MPDKLQMETHLNTSGSSSATMATKTKQNMMCLKGNWEMDIGIAAYSLLNDIGDDESCAPCAGGEQRAVRTKPRKQDKPPHKQSGNSIDTCNLFK